jgi:hypothetical protein
MIIDFLHKDIPQDKLENALEVLLIFKECESFEEQMAIPFAAWDKLEQLEEFLEHRVNNEELREDTIREIETYRKEPE